MRSLTAAVLLVASASVAAECYLRSATVVSSKANVQRVADVKETKLPYNGLRKCIAQMRIQVNNEWTDAEGEGVAETDEQACSNARELAQARFLTPVTNPVVNAESSMVCTDAPQLKFRERVRVGDLVRESEVGVHHGYPNPFRHKGTQCKWFIHSEAHLGKLVSFGGIMCATRSEQWQVVDLF
jgi:hypothetical protein